MPETKKKEESVRPLEEDPTIRKGERYIVLLENDHGMLEMKADVIEEKLFEVSNPLVNGEHAPFLAPRLAKVAKELVEQMQEDHKRRLRKRKEGALDWDAGVPKKKFKSNGHTPAAADGQNGNHVEEEPMEDSPECHHPEEFHMPAILSFPMYYVHYIDADRRLDRWVPRWKFLRRLPSGDSTPAPVATRSKTNFDYEFNKPLESFERMTPKAANLEKEHEQATRVKTVEAVQFSDHVIESWYFSPYSSSFTRNGIVFICEFCLLYTHDYIEFYCHKANACNQRHPPGTEIYRSENISVFEVRGDEQRFYCQSLCLLGKLFLDHKTLFYDVTNFNFYVLCETRDDGEHPVGFFSKENDSPLNNLACIMILPPKQRKGYGSFLIQLSYELSRREQLVAGPEYPLSDMGRIAYRKYWNLALMYAFRKNKYELMSIPELRASTGLREVDIMYVIKLWKLRNPHKVETFKEGDEILVQVRKGMRPGTPPTLILNHKLLEWTPKVMPMDARKRLMSTASTR